MLHHIQTSVKALIELILPSRCPSCGAIIKECVDHGVGAFCSDCWADTQFITKPWCATCAIPFEFESDEMPRQCGACMQNPPRHDGIRAAIVYGDISRSVITKLKYGGRIAIAKLVAQHMMRFIDEDIASLGGDIWLVPVPLHWTRLLKRTYNQSALIADALLEASNKTQFHHYPDVLRRIKKTPPLIGADSKQRKQLLKNAIALDDKYKASIRGRNIILVDDVYTSGATTDECVKILKAAGAETVLIYCWTRVIN